jgi:hypothetical protein
VLRFLEQPGALPRWCCAGQPLLPNCVGSRGANSRTRRRDGVGRAPGWLSRGGQGGWRVVAAWRACLPPGAGARAAGRAPPGAAGASPRWLPRCWLVGCRAGALIRSWSWPALSWSTQGGRRSGCGRDAGGGGQDAGRGRCRGGAAVVVGRAVVGGAVAVSWVVAEDGRAVPVVAPTLAGARCSCSTPPPRSNPNRLNRSRPEASPRTKPPGSSRPNREMGVALLQGLPDLGNSWLGGGSRSRGSEGA